MASSSAIGSNVPSSDHISAENGQPPHNEHIYASNSHTNSSLDTANALLRIRLGEGYAEPGGVQPPPEWSEDEECNVPRRHLGFWQILAILINSVIGTGIFTQPGYVLFLTKSKPVALGLWAIGGLYTAITMLIFVEYGIALPFNGGPMIYLDECFPNPQLLVLTVYSIHRILLGTSEDITRALALILLRLANPGASADDFSNGMISLVSISVIATVCLLVYFAPPLVFAANVPMAAFKVILVLVISICGLAKLSGRYEGVSDFNQSQEGFDGVATVQAMLFIIFSYQGYINTNCIAGEINNIKKDLCRASAVAVIIITGCYMLFTAVLYSALSYADLTSNEGQADAASLLIVKCFGSGRSMLVAEGISAFGTMLIQIYAVARVKQAAAWRRIIPFYEFIGRESSFRSPGGALLVHGIFTSIPLLALRNSSEAVRSFATGIFTWGRQVIISALGLGLLRLGAMMRSTLPTWRFTYLRTSWSVNAAAGLVAASALAIAVLAAIPAGDPPRYLWVVITAAVVLGATIYWVLLRLLMVPVGADGKTVGSKIGLEAHILEFRDKSEAASSTPMIWEAMHEGKPRFVTYELSGYVAKWHALVSRAFAALWRC